MVCKEKQQLFTWFPFFFLFYLTHRAFNNPQIASSGKCRNFAHNEAADRGAKLKVATNTPDAKAPIRAVAAVEEVFFLKKKKKEEE